MDEHLAAAETNRWPGRLALGIAIIAIHVLSTGPFAYLTVAEIIPNSEFIRTASFTFYAPEGFILDSGNEAVAVLRRPLREYVDAWISLAPAKPPSPIGCGGF